jgi:mannan endo-1,4-beta-mannosidase
MIAAKSVKAVFRSTIEIEPTPSCTRTLSADAQKVLAYLTRLSDDKAPGVIVGQNCSTWWFICPDPQFQESVGALHDQSGKWPGILSLAYEDTRMHPPNELSSANRQLTIPHWQAGGLMMISVAPVNPWGSEGWTDVNIKYPQTDLRELLPGGSKRGRWLASMDRLAGALAELRDAGVVVLFRPMQEMNDTFFWWSKRNLSDKHEAYIALWRDMFNYFTCVKRLDNLLWVFAPGGSLQAWSSWPYPGDAYVDVVAPTTYNNDLAMPSYSDALAYGKPIGISEYGPSAYSDVATGFLDNRKYAERLQHDYPRVAFFVVWSSWEGVKMSLADNLYANELMNDPRVITRDEIAWR